MSYSFLRPLGPNHSLTYTSPHPLPKAPGTPDPAIGRGSWELGAAAGARAPGPLEAPSWVALDLGMPLRRDRKGIRGDGQREGV